MYPGGSDSAWGMNAYRFNQMNTANTRMIETGAVQPRLARVASIEM